jgi:hypothetical protein
MSASLYESLCSHLENTLQIYLTGLVDGSELGVDLLSGKFFDHYRELERSGDGEAGWSSCVATILKYKLIPLHMACVHRHASVNKTASYKAASYKIWYCFMPLVFAHVVMKSERGKSFLLPLRDCLLKHDYVSLLLSEYLAFQKLPGAIDVHGHWQAASHICCLIEFILQIEGSEIQQGQQQQLSGSINWDAATAFRSPQPALLSDELERFLLQCLSLALRKVYTDQAPPGALASFSQGRAGQFLGGFISLIYLCKDVHYLVHCTMK